MKRCLLLLVCSLVFFSCSSVRAEEEALLYAREAMEQLKQDNSAMAVQLFSKALEIDPSSVIYRYNLGLALLQENQYEAVIVLSDESFHTFPDQLGFLQLKAKALSEGGRQKEALEVYQSLFALNPGSYALQKEVMLLALQWGYETEAEALAYALVSSGEYEEAAFSVLSALKGNTSWYAYARMYLTKEDATQAP